VLRKWQRCSKLDGILGTERNRFHEYLRPVQMASLPSGYHFALRPVVSSVSTELQKPRGDDARAGFIYRSHHHLPASVQHYTPELEKRCRPHLKMTNDWWRVDETYVKVKKAWMYPYRAVDSQRNTLEFLLSPRRDASLGHTLLLKGTSCASHQYTSRHHG
jgi:transposase, IS6 family